MGFLWPSGELNSSRCDSRTPSTFVIMTAGISAEIQYLGMVEVLIGKLGDVAVANLFGQ